MKDPNQVEDKFLRGFFAFFGPKQQKLTAGEE
jgi:hypothetical protein